MARLILGLVIYSGLILRALAAQAMKIVDCIIQEIYDLGIKFQEAHIQPGNSDE